MARRLIDTILYEAGCSDESISIQNTTHDIIESGMKKAIVFLIICNFLIRLPFLNSVTTFDETHIAYTRWMAQSGLNPFIAKPPEKNTYDRSWLGLSYKAPLTVLIPAIMVKFLGVSRVWGRVSTAIFSSLALYYSFLLGKRLFSEKVGLGAAVMLFFLPIFFTQSFMYLDTVPTTCITLATLYYFFKRSWGKYLLAGSLLVLTKETGVITLVGLILCYLLFFRRNPASPLWAPIMKTALPIIAFITWALLNIFYFGTVFGLSYTDHKTLPEILKILSSTSYIQSIINTLFFHWYSGAIFLPLTGAWVISLFYKKIRSTLWHPHAKSLIFLAFIHFLFLLFYGAYSSKYDIIPRYYLPLYATSLLLLSACFELEIHNGKIRAFAYVIVIAIFVVSFIYPLPNSFDASEETQQYFLYRSEHQKVVRYLENQMRTQDDVLLASWPYIGYWTEPMNGYVTKTKKGIFCNIPIVDCIDLALQSSHSEKMTIYIVVDDYSNQWQEIHTLIKYPLMKLAEFGHNNVPRLSERILIYQVNLNNIHKLNE